jgi:penicillin-binding protein 2
MVVENSGFGAQNAAPIARRVFDFLLLGQYPSEEDIAAVQIGQATKPIGKPRPVANVQWFNATEKSTSESLPFNAVVSP